MIERVGIGTVVTAASGNLVPGLPAGLAVNDIMVLWYASANAPGGIPAVDPVWDAQVANATGSGILFLPGFGLGMTPAPFAAWMRYDGTTPSTTVTSPAAASGEVAWIAAYRGCAVEGYPFDTYLAYNPSTGDPLFDVLGTMEFTGSAVATITYPALTPKFLGDMVVQAWFTTGQGTNGPILGADPEVTTVLDGTTALGPGMSYGFADGLSQSGSPLPVRSSTFSATGTNIGVTMLLKPQDAVGIPSPIAPYAVSHARPQ